MKKFFLTLLFLLIAGLCFSSVIQTKKGPVNFPHSSHTAIMQCLECHDPHGMMGLGQVDATHAFCWSCHDPKVEPQKCKFCHQSKK